MTVEQTLADLVAIDSVSARSNAEMISYLSRRCAAMGLITENFAHRVNGVEKINLVAVSAAAESKTASSLRSAGVIQIELALVGHTDTVPYEPSWADALVLKRDGDRLFGRGACDTKAFIAAALTAAEKIDLTKIKKPLALVFTCDEEIGCLGAKRLADRKPFTARYAIVGEPTSLQPIRAGKGYCLAEITVRGREAHSAYPQLGSSAIFRAARLVQQIESIAAELKREQHPGFDPPYTTLNVGMISGGTAKNIIAGECRFALEWRTIPGQNSTRVLDLVAAAIEELKQADSEFVAELNPTRADDSFETPGDSALVTFLENVCRQASASVAFGTEAPSMIALGAEAVVLGPGDIRVAHRTGEYVPIAELNQCVAVLERAIEEFCC